ncbi:HSP20 family protein [Winogradskyella epiphytica]|uniref:HSP20 family protein n=1 Tax=Winogradskyella epiphytica TaxID=262005 RepID=A0A2V4WW94_9FLAO|nr:Hsp20/alpha crystallin family protein [Winogradskyella epiphytica]PYE80972.1 HSP20 family protein [Winogradskyella epiphytica]GGW65904.1 heat-shock protein [Winogradskyella epiphytica]
MSNLVNVPKSGGLSNTNSNISFPTWSSWIDEMFNRELPSVFTSNFNTGMSSPKVNIKETEDAFEVEMAVPGLNKSDFKIDLDNDTLSISTEVKEEKEHTEENYTRREFGYSSFKRVFTLPESINEDHINAKYENGILNIHLPKKEEVKQKPVRSIEIS